MVHVHAGGEFVVVEAGRDQLWLGGWKQALQIAAEEIK